MKIDTALYNNEKQYQLEGYFIVDTILSRDFSDVYVFLMPRLLRYSFCLAAFRRQRMPFRPPFAAAGEQIIKNTGSSTFELITRLI